MMAVTSLDAMILAEGHMTTFASSVFQPLDSGHDKIAGREFFSQRDNHLEEYFPLDPGPSCHVPRKQLLIQQ
jgi:hypothetical protein